MIVGETETEKGHLVLIRWSRGLELYLNGVALMTLSEARSELELARLGAAKLSQQMDRPIEALVLGLGLGATVRELLHQPRVGRVVVIELFSALPKWLGDAPETTEILRDLRVEVVVADAAQLPLAVRPAFDLILLDVGNGPLDPVIDENASLYAFEGLTTLRRFLRAGGVLGVWAAHRSERFEADLERSFERFEVVEVPLPSGRPDLEPDLIYLVQRSG